MQEDQLKFCCRWSPTLGKLEDTHQNIWGTEVYQPLSLSIAGIDLAHNTLLNPTVFFGVYGLRDFVTLWAHKGKRYILWAGSDIQHFLNGYFLDLEGKMRIHPTQLASWIDSNCISFVENEVEKIALASVGIRAKIVPSFLGDASKFPISYIHNAKPKLYTSVSGDEFLLYGWDKIPQLALDNPGIEFHCYGNKQYPWAVFKEKFKEGIPANIILHGKVKSDTMNEEIKSMQGALRLTTFDGFSEILAKSILMGQWPVSFIEYPYMLKINEIGKLAHLIEPNISGREFYLKELNAYPWNTKK